MIAGLAMIGLVGAQGATCLGCLPFPLEMKLGTWVSPSTLPKRKLAPVDVQAKARISHVDGHPSALREMTIDVDKDVEMDVEGLAACGYREIAARPVVAARRRCRHAIVGSGEAEASLLFPGAERTSMKSPLTVFNGGRRDRFTVLFVHGYAQLPRPKAIVARIEVERIGSGLHSVIRVPVLADGYGSLTEMSLELTRSFFDRGRRKSFLSASCPDGVFKVMTPKTFFRNEARVPGVGAQTVLKGSLAVPCRPRG